MFQPVVQAAKVNLLLLIVRLTGAVDIETAGSGTNAGQLVQVEEAEAEDEPVLGGADVFG